MEVEIKKKFLKELSKLPNDTVKHRGEIYKYFP